MADSAKLMHPLRSESLRPRPSAQAQYVPPALSDAPAEPDPKPFSAPLMAHMPSLTSAPNTPPPACSPPQESPSAQEQNEPPTEQEIPIDALLKSLISEPPEHPDDPLDDLLKSFIGESADEETLEDEPDAIPTDKMPKPVFVPLYEDPPRRRRWPWIVPLLLCLLGAAAAAAWKAGLFESILP